MNRIEEINARKVEIRSLIEGADMETLGKFKEELEALNSEETELRAKESLLKAIETNPNIGTSINLKQEESQQMTNVFETMEYRNAFMQFVTNNTPMPEEFRAAANSVTSDNAAVLPTTVLNEVVQKLESYGDILPRVRRTQFAAGVAVPSTATKFTATWQIEDATGESQKMATTSIVFAAYQLRCVAAVSFQMETRSLAAFESALIANIADAMAVALEAAVIKGTGTGQPKGITKETAAKSLQVGADVAYKDIVKIVKAIPSAYKKDTVLIMNEGTALTLAGLQDTNGQPIGGVNTGIDGAPQYRFLGKEVVLTNALPDIEDAKTGEAVIVAFDLSKYMLNTSYDVDLQEYKDNATRAKVYDSVCLVDGKAVDVNGLVLVNKK